MTHRIRLPVFGHWIEIAAAEPRVIAMATAAFGAWSRLPASLAADGLAGQVSVEIAGPAPARLAPFEWQMSGALMTAHAGAARLTIDPVRREARCVVPAAALDDAEWFAWHALAPVRLLASLDDRLPIHAAGVAFRDRVALIAGSSGSGKSTTTFACHRQGLRVLSEDSVFAALRGGVAIWGQSPAIFLAEDVARWYPELAGAEPMVRANGKRRVRIGLDEDAAPLVVRGIPTVFILEPSMKSGRVEALTAAEWRDYRARPLEPGFSYYARAWDEAQPCLDAWPAFRLGTAADPLGAARRIVEILQAVV